MGVVVGLSLSYEDSKTWMMTNRDWSYQAREFSNGVG